MPAPLPVLLWDQLAAAPAADGSVITARLPAEDGGLSLCGFLEGLSPTPRSIVLLYQSPSLESVTAACPRNVRRRALQQVLTARFPVLASPSTAWAVHPPSTAGAGTLLYIAQSPFLAQLQAALAGRRIRLEGAYPVFAAVEAGPPFGPGGTPALAVLNADHGAGVFWVSPGGDRQVAFYSGPSARDRMLQALATGMSIFGDQPRPSLLLIDAATTPLAPGTLPMPSAQTVSLGDFLRAVAGRRLPELSNLQPPPPRAVLEPVLHLVTALSLAAALFSGYQYLAARQQARLNQAIQQAQARALAEEVTRLEAKQRETERIELFLAELAGGPRVKGRFLLALGKARTPLLTLQSVILNESTWSLTGTQHEGHGGERTPFDEFSQGLFTPSAAWLPGADARSTKGKTAGFTLNGTFR
jgi:hypothetical protein